MITGPVKFNFYTGNIKRSALAFWCVMMERKIFDELGYLDEIFSPGMGEDGDFCIKAELAGHELVQVPEDGMHEFNSPESKLPWSRFPMMHKGSGTFGWLDAGGLIERNKAILNSRYGNQMAKYSIVIPTYNHCNDLLKPCLESIVQYTDTNNIEVIVVANGCTDNTKEYVESLGAPFKLIWVDEALGYTKATNLGIKASIGEYVVLLNNDTLLLPQEKNQWLNQLEAPFAKKEVGLAGPLELYDNYANAPVLIFFCVMIKREVFDKIGLLDEIFSPGGGEDIDFTIRARQAGYESKVLAKTEFNGTTNIGTFPIWHKDNKTFVEMPEYTNWIVKRNGLINCLRYNKDIKLNLGGGGINYSGYLNVDLYDKRAHILTDITKLTDFPDNSVSEILASHVFEHLNPYHVWNILHEWKRVLKPGGKLVMEMPNIEELCRRFVTASKMERYGILNAVYGSVNTTDVGGPDNITSPHLFGWWPEVMWDYMMGVGFTDIVIGPEKIPHPESNFRVEGTKPGVSIDKELYKQQEPITFKEIFIDDNYRLVESEIKNKRVIDIGANLGFFSLRCVELGAKKVIAVEPQPVIYNQGLLPNIKKFPAIVPLNFAVLDKDGQTVNIVNKHVASHITSGTGDPVKTVTLKWLVDDVDDNDIVLKLDCEGSEFDILMSTDRDTLRKFSVIHIEMHSGVNENPEYRDPVILRQRLEDFGFKQVYTSPLYWQENQRETNVNVEKWVRQ